MFTILTAHFTHTHLDPVSLTLADNLHCSTGERGLGESPFPPATPLFSSMASMRISLSVCRPRWTISFSNCCWTVTRPSIWESGTLSSCEGWREKLALLYTQTHTHMHAYLQYTHTQTHTHMHAYLQYTQGSKRSHIKVAAADGAGSWGRSYPQLYQLMYETVQVGGV